MRVLDLNFIYCFSASWWGWIWGWAPFDQKMKWACSSLFKCSPQHDADLWPQVALQTCSTETRSIERRISSECQECFQKLHLNIFMMTPEIQSLNSTSRWVTSCSSSSRSSLKAGGLTLHRGFRGKEGATDTVGDKRESASVCWFHHYGQQIRKQLRHKAIKVL